MYSNNCFLQEMRISCICQNEYKYFLRKLNVIGVGLGYKITNGLYTKNICITVFVKEKLPNNMLPSNEIIPNFYKGFLTDVVDCAGLPKFQSLTLKVRPVICGYSVGNILYNDSGGTCGCLVRDNYLYMLSSNHVLAKTNEAPLNSSIVQPAVQYGGKTPGNIVAFLKKFIPLKFIEGRSEPKNQVDCAIVKVFNKSLASPEIAFVGVPKGIGKPKLNEPVKKVGATSELTDGRITNLSTTILMDCGSKQALFTNQIITTKITDPGDSGALLLDENNNALGLCMGGINQITVSNSISLVLKNLKVNLVTS
ncbi:trypsin-like peptidase domain-containing protein (plasmid) [Clostridium botulinum]|uniref:Nal1 N-terminal domain-containing protein n=2 Tax=Clostridium botulinum TaxID=1491 RepID=A0A0A0I045_CLOBO|nr:trypsin-like peptidase domain-containing protein [Clostridium botulinum]KEH99929.1 hypothetical protein Z952_14810 [Clostridium botulinum C/D str. BKT75002]KEI05561.1 hypothetical protein Z954_15010 [Clostridium botulinum C/D str. BKT2873]KGM93005.1 hypothetical protein Z955_16235 [Clostridium botulinum C/D str. DC5]KOC51399.1 hypothetical protein ADU89_13625 [Clostridium botulinum]KOC52059.1 hypothetical protein ADU90_14885 [Clostridium botulinum]